MMSDKNCVNCAVCECIVSSNDCVTCEICDVQVHSLCLRRDAKKHRNGLVNSVWK